MQEAILKFEGSKGVWNLTGTRSTGRKTCSDTYRLEGSSEYQEMDRDKVHALAKQKKIVISGEKTMLWEGK